MLNNITYSPNLNNNSLFEGKEFASRVNYKKVMGNSTNFTGPFKFYNDNKQTIWGKKSDDDLEGQKIRRTLERFGVSFSNEGRELLESSNISVDEFIERYSKEGSKHFGDYSCNGQDCCALYEFGSMLRVLNFIHLYLLITLVFCKLTPIIS